MSEPLSLNVQARSVGNAVYLEHKVAGVARRPPARGGGVMPEVVVIDGREFAVGDYVLVWLYGRRWQAATIDSIENDHEYPIVVRWNRICYYPCRASEVHSFRENFA